ncbi:ATP-binding protein [Streptomyces sp.]|uniref:ATP-binding protein n=1 Tax=Streptomyces sp. TaxID=1931 RepID=UPI0028110C0C|nr:ATP-binding protein [Streptomyces sp.]
MLERDQESRPLAEYPVPVSVSAAFEGGEEIAAARALARSFLADARIGRGQEVPDETVDIVQLVVSELVTNARRHAPGPFLLTLRVQEREQAVEVTVWDTEPDLPLPRPADPTRVGQHGLEIVMALCRSFAIHREPVGKRITATVALADPLGDETGR